MSASLIIKRNVLQTCSTCVGYRLITGTEKHSRHQEEKKEGTGAISPALKFSPIHWPLGETVCVTCGPGESWPTTAVCLQPAGVPVCRHLWGRMVLQRPRLPALPPLLRHLCWYHLPAPLIYPSSSGLAFVCLSLSISLAHPLVISFFKLDLLF